MSTNAAKQLPPYLSVVADKSLGEIYWVKARAPDTVEGFVLDVYHLHPQDTDGLTHREENATYHIIDIPEIGPPHYHTLPRGHEIK